MRSLSQILFLAFVALIYPYSEVDAQESANYLKLSRQFEKVQKSCSVAQKKLKRAKGKKARYVAAKKEVKKACALARETFKKLSLAASKENRHPAPQDQVFDTQTPKVEALQTRAGLPYAENVPQCTAVGDQKLAVVIVRHSDLSLQESDFAAIESQVFSDQADSLKSIIHRASLGKLRLSGRVVRSDIVLNRTSANCSLSLESEGDEIMNKVRNAVNPSEFTRVMVFVLAGSGCNTSVRGGSVGCGVGRLGNSSFVGSFSSVLHLLHYPRSENIKSMVHEFGHDLGLDHASGFWTTAGDSRAIFPDSDYRAGVKQRFEYGNTASVMGSGYGLMNFSAPEKAALGWYIEGQDYVTVRSSGYYYLISPDWSQYNLKALKVIRPRTAGSAVWLEPRRLPIDPKIAQLYSGDPYSSLTNRYQGITAHYVYSDGVGNTAPMNVDFRPLTYGFPALMPAQQWNDPYSTQFSIRYDWSFYGWEAINISLMPEDLPPINRASAASLVAAKFALPGVSRDASAVFSDVAQSSAEYFAIQRLFFSGITSGCSYDPATGIRRYCPTDSALRWQFAVFASRASGITTPNSYSPRFSDVPPEHPAFANIQALAERGAITECAPGKFCPDRGITSADANSMADRARTAQLNSGR